MVEQAKEASSDESQHSGVLSSGVTMCKKGTQFLRAKKTKNKTSKKPYAAVVKEEEEQSWKRYLEEVEVFEETDPAQVSAVNKDKKNKNKNTRKFEVAEGSGGRTVSPRPPCLVFYKTHQNHLCVPGAHNGQWPKPVHAGDVYFPTDSNFSLEDLARVDWKDVVRAEEAEICRQKNVQDGSGPEGKSLEQMEDIPKCPNGKVQQRVTEQDHECEEYMDLKQQPGGLCGGGQGESSIQPPQASKFHGRQRCATEQDHECEEDMDLKQQQGGLCGEGQSESSIQPPQARSYAAKEKISITLPSPEHVSSYAPATSTGPNSPTPSAAAHSLSFETVELMMEKIKQLEMQDPKVALSRQLEEKGRLVELLKQKIKGLEMQEVKEATNMKTSTLLESPSLTDSEDNEIDQQVQRGKKKSKVRRKQNAKEEEEKEAKNSRAGSPVILYLSNYAISGLELVRLRGGAGRRSATLPELAVRSAFRMNILLRPGRPNPAAGNCLFESCIYNNNDREELFPKIQETVNECRILWVTLLKTQVPVYRPEMDAYSEDDWDKMMQDGQWNQELGDLMPFAVAFGTKKRILIWHCYEEAIDPVSIVEPEEFGQD